MGITIKTDKLKEMVSRVVKGASNNKLIPLTSLMAIKLDDGVLTFITTDATNYLYIREDKVVGEDFHITVPVELFSKLISRTTCENTTLTLESNCLKVKGNGIYSIELPLDEEGELIRYPDPVAELAEADGVDTINSTTVSVILNSLKPSLAVTLEEPCYTGYYVGDRIVATDTYKIACMDVKLFEEPRLISPEMMNLLSVMSVEKVTVELRDNILVFTAPDCVIYGTTLEGVEDYAIDAILGLVDMEFSSMCKVPKSMLLQVLDRLSLFVSTYDKNGVYLTFTKQGMNISSKSSNGVEVIPYVESVGFEDFTCCVDIEMLSSQVKAQAADVVELYYGLDNAIKFVDGNITHVIALLEDDRLDEE